MSAYTKLTSGCVSSLEFAAMVSRSWGELAIHGFRGLAARSGWCYLNAVRESRVEQFAVRFGPWIRLCDLGCLDMDALVDVGQLRNLRLRGVSDGVVHVVKGGSGVSLLQALSSLVSDEDEVCFQEGTLGYFARSEVGEFSTALRVHTCVGGLVSPEWEGWAAKGGAQAMVAYYSAFVCEAVSAGTVPKLWFQDVGLLESVVENSKEGFEGTLGSKLELPVKDDGFVEEKSAACLGSSGRGKNWERNQEWKKERKERKYARRHGCLPVNAGLQRSLEEKWEAENRLAKEKAERQLELMRARDLESEKKMQRAQIMRTTEAAKVQTERAYATLKRTGNVPGFAETVVTDGSCPALSPSRSDGTCISPDSSVSQQEIRAMMKELEDYKLTVSRMRRDNSAFVDHHMEGHGVKTAFTLDSDGLCPVDEPGSMGADGKYHLDSYEPNPRFYKDRFRAEEFAEKYFGS